MDNAIHTIKLKVDINSVPIKACHMIASILKPGLTQPFIPLLRDGVPCSVLLRNPDAKG